MSFSPDWLGLRESADALARDRTLTRRLAAWAAGRAPVEVVDLGSGTGANLRFLAPHLPVAQHWRLIERDPVLIASGQSLLADLPFSAHYVEGDLRASLPDLLSPAPDLVTASALIDLVSERWLRGLADYVTARDTALLVVLSFDGRIELGPDHPLDAEVVGLVLEHQRKDKGFGAALGPAATGCLAELLRPAGGELLAAHSDWRLGSGAPALQLELVKGYAAAARELRPAVAGPLEEWLAFRQAAIENGSGRCRVGHEDLLWLPG